MKKKRFFRGRTCHGWMKLLVMMKLTTFLLFLSVMAMATGSYSQNTRFDLNVRNASIVQVLEEIEQQTEYGFLFKTDQLDLNERYTLSFKGARIETVMNEVLDRDLYSYRIMDRIIVISKKGADMLPVWDQATVKVSGQAVDSSGQPLPGVSVIIKGTTNGTVTNADGKYSLSNIPEDAVLQFSFVGMRTQEITVAGKTSINVTMAEDAIGIEEVVAIGYGTQKKVNLTGAIASISAEELSSVPISNISNAMGGRMAGLFSMNKSSNPGTSSDITIRGVSTVNTTSPIYVIDGVLRDKTDFDGIDPNTIETITILKDAASCAVYGSRAANGVILVTTKRGKVQKTTFNYSALFGMENITKDVEMMNAYEYSEYYNKYLLECGYSSDYSSYFTSDEQEYFKTHSTDWWDLCTKMPFTQQHNLSVSGGAESIQYMLSSGYYHQNGMLIGGHNTYDRYNIRSNIDAKLTDNLKITLDVDLLRSVKDTPFWPYNSSEDYLDNLYLGIKNSPSYMPSKINGLYDKTFFGWNPIAVLNEAGYKNYINNTTNVKFSFKYDIKQIKGFSVEGMFDYRYYDYKTKKLSRSYKLYSHETSGEHNHIVYEDAEVTSYTTRSDGNYIKKQNDDQSSYTLNFKVNYNRTFGKHDIGAMFIYEQYEDKTDYFYAAREYLEVDGVEQLWSGSSSYQYASGYEGENGRLGYIGRVNYSYDNKYLFEGNCRYDGSMIFSEDNRWGFFPSASAAWRLSEESFIKGNSKLSFIDNLKIRASYGLLGNDQVDAFQWQQTYTMTTGGVFGSDTGTGSTAVYAGSYPNSDITWEKTATLDFGIDAQLWNGLLGIETDYFRKRTTDVLRSRERSVPETFGADLPDENYAEIKNHGFEFTLTHNNHIGGFKYYTSFNFSFARNKWVVVDESSAAASYDYLRLTGRPISFLTGYEAVGIARTQEDLDNAPTYQGVEYELGDLILKDQTGDNNITTADQVVLSKKSGTPEIIYGFSIGGTWKNFDLNMFFQGVGNRKIMSPIKGQAYTEATPMAVWTNTWSESNPDASMPKIGGLTSAKNAREQSSSFWLRDASFLRFKNLEIGYTIPKTLIKRIGLNNCRLFFSGTNLFLLRDKIKDYDPENTSSNGAFQYPSNRTYDFGVNISF